MRPLPARADFLVLGGGPAGSTFAALAAASGATILLLEGGGYGRRRPGEYLDPFIREVFALLGITAAEVSAIAEPSPAIVSLWESKKPLTQAFRARGPVPPIAVQRHALDRLLADAAARAGAVCVACPGSPHLSPLADGWRVELPTTAETASKVLEADRIVDATGRRARFAGRLAGGRETQGALFATSLWFSKADTIGHAVGPLVIETARNGWWSLVETPGDELAAVYYTHRGTLPARRGERLEHAFAALSAAPFIEAILRRKAGAIVEGRTFAAFPAITRTLHGERWLAVGDAAASYDPLCGKGTIFAIQSAVRAAQAWTQGGIADRKLYGEATRYRWEAHLASRREVYESAGPHLSQEFRQGELD